ncbi:MAG: glycosyltransferase family 2 protein [Actinobacteria bacterium]|nr:glycosyltransferase family 2 protein [Actinomycetota bacterium]
MSTDFAPLIALGMPLYNSSRYLDESLEALHAQTHERFVLVLTDDGSTDGTPAIAQRWCTRDERFMFASNSRRLGLVGNWRRVFERALVLNPETRYFAWVGDHDLCQPRWLELLVAALQARPAAVLAYPRSAAISETGEPLRFRPREFASDGLGDRSDRLRATITGASAGWAVYGLFRTEALRSCGVLRAVILPDRLLLAEISLYGQVHQVPDVLWHRRFRPGETSTLARQRETLFPDGAPWHSHLPWPVAHANALVSSLVIAGAGRPAIGRARGLQFASRYLAWGSVHDSRDDGFLRSWRITRKRWMKRSKGWRRYRKTLQGRLRQIRAYPRLRLAANLFSARGRRRLHKQWRSSPVRSVLRRAALALGARTVKRAARRWLRRGGGSVIER